MPEDFQALENIIATAGVFLVTYGFQIIGAIIILVIGWWIAGRIAGLVLGVSLRAKLDLTLAKFFANVTKGLVLAFVIILALNNFGISIAPFVAAVGAIAFGATLAIQGSLSNYGAGLSLIITRPFVVGDTIKIQGVTGQVEDIKLAYTLLTNEDGESILIPNRHIIGEILHNTRAGMLVEASIGISYQSDPDKAIAIVREVLSALPDVVKDPAAQVGIENFGDSSIDIGYRYWVPTKQSYQTQYTVNGEIYRRLQTAGITIPLPQREVRMLD